MKERHILAQEQLNKHYARMISNIYGSTQAVQRKTTMNETYKSNTAVVMASLVTGLIFILYQVLRVVN